MTGLILPEGIEYIGSNAFNNSALETIQLPQSLVEIGQYAFSKTNLTEIIIPANVETIGSSTFDYEGISKESPLKKVTFKGNKIKKIETGTFSYCKNLTDITLPKGLEVIDYNSFERCESLESITIPDSVTEIGEAAFVFCTKLKSVVIGDGVISIGERAFGECIGLENVTIGKNIEFIGKQAFNTKNSRDKMSLASITIHNSTTVPHLDDDTRGVFPKPGGFDPVNYKIYVPADMVSKYQTEWKDYKSLINSIL